MDIFKLIEDIDRKYQEVIGRINAVKSNYNNKVIPINEDIEEVELHINNALLDVKKGMKGATKWVQGRIDTVVKDINEGCQVVTSTINEKFDIVKTNYEKRMLTFKMKSLKSIFAKIGIDADDEFILNFIETTPVPHPKIDSLLPEIKLEFPTPDVEAKINEAIENGTDYIELPKLPYL